MSLPSSAEVERDQLQDQLSLAEDGNFRKPIRVLLYGKAGDGKSTLGNMLLGGHVEGYFQTRDSPTTVSSAPLKKSSLNELWEVIDTVGLFSPKNLVSDASLTENLYRFLARECPVIDVICYVKKASAFTGVDGICFNHFKCLFKGHKVEQNVVLVFTSCPDQGLFFKFNEKLISKHMGEEFKYRVGVELPPTNVNVEIEEMMREKRRSSLKDLEDELKRVVSECVGPVDLTLNADNRLFCYNTLKLEEVGVAGLSEQCVSMAFFSQENHPKYYEVSLPPSSRLPE